MNMKITGTITNIIKGEPKDSGYGLSVNTRLEVGGVQYSAFVKECKFNPGQFPVKCGKIGDWKEVVVGDNVEFEATQNGQYNNFKTTTMMKLAGAPVTTAAPQQASVAAVTSPAAQPKSQADIEQAQAVRNNHMNLGGLLHDGTTLVAAMMQCNWFSDTELKKLKKDNGLFMALVRETTQELYKLKEEMVLDPAGDLLFKEDVGDDEAK